MISAVSTIVMLVITYVSCNNNNPVNVSLILIISITALSILLYQLSGESWFPIIFYILFLGGILIIFLILSTINPNVNINNTNPIATLIIAAFLLGITQIVQNASLTSTSNLAALSWLPQSNQVLSFLTIIICLYFLIFTILVSIENSSLRTSI